MVLITTFDDMNQCSYNVCVCMCVCVCVCVCVWVCVCVCLYVWNPHTHAGWEELNTHTTKVGEIIHMNTHTHTFTYEYT